MRPSGQASAGTSSRSPKWAAQGNVRTRRGGADLGGTGVAAQHPRPTRLARGGYQGSAVVLDRRLRRLPGPQRQTGPAEDSVPAQPSTKNHQHPQEWLPNRWAGRAVPTARTPSAAPETGAVPISGYGPASAIHPSARLELPLCLSSGGRGGRVSPPPRTRRQTSVLNRLMGARQVQKEKEAIHDLASSLTYLLDYQ